MDSSRTDKFKKWYDRNKQKIILLLGMAVVLILIFGLIIRGVLSIQSNTSTDERVASEDIAFDIVAETPRTQGGTDEKLYQERLANREKHIPLLRIVHKFPAQRRVTLRPRNETPWRKLPFSRNSMRSTIHSRRINPIPRPQTSPRPSHRVR